MPIPRDSSAFGSLIKIVRETEAHLIDAVLDANIAEQCLFPALQANSPPIAPKFPTSPLLQRGLS